jgi:hypothetical protein
LVDLVEPAEPVDLVDPVEPAEPDDEPPCAAVWFSMAVSAPSAVASVCSSPAARFSSFAT